VRAPRAGERPVRASWIGFLPSARVLAGLLAAGLLAGCGQGGEEGDGGEAPPPPGTPLAIDSSPSRSVGVLGGDPAEEFGRVLTPFLSPSGRLVVPDAGSLELRVFGPGGTPVDRLGGPGKGPGEFVDLRGAWTRGDTIEAWDGGARRITRFLPDGEVEVISVGGEGVHLDSSVGPLGEGWGLVSLEFGAFDEGRARDRAGLVRVSRDGRIREPIVELEGMERHLLAGRSSAPHPFTPPTGLFAVLRGEIYAAEGRTPRVEVRDPSGDLLREISLSLRPPGPPDAVLEDVIDSLETRRGDAGNARGLYTPEALRNFPEAEALPVLWALLVDPEGFLWVRPYDPFVHSLVLGGHPAGRGGPGGSWLLVAPDGAEVGTIEVPDGFEPRSVGRDVVVGVHVDELGVETVRVHRLRRRGG